MSDPEKPRGARARRDYSAADRLDTWKEIAAHLQRSVRTVQRWEGEEGLPVHRHHHQKQGSVYAFRPELDAWWRAHERSGATPPAAGHATAGAAPVATGQPETAAVAAIAVLPFVNLSTDADNEYFADGVAEEIINTLAGTKGLRVASRTSAFRFKGSGAGLREIADRLGVTTVLEGSVRRSGDRVRITAQLIDADSDDHLWSQTFDREVEDIFAIQDEIAAAIADKLSAELGGRFGLAAARRRTGSVKAYQAYLKGRHHWDKRTLAGLEAASRFFAQAIEADPGYAAAQAGLADAFNMLGYYSHQPPNKVFPRAKAAAHRALELDSLLAEGHASLGFATMFYDWEFSAAREQFSKALELKPDYPIARYWYGINLGALGRFWEAIEQVRRARELDPASPLINVYVAGAYYFGRQFEQAEKRCISTLELDPDFQLAHLMLGWVYRQQGRFRDAIAALSKALKLSEDSIDSLAHMAHAHALSGNGDEARRILAELRKLARKRYVSPGHMALVHLGLGNRRHALDWLDKAYDERYAWLVFLEIDPLFDDLRDEPRFRDLVDRIGL